MSFGSNSTGKSLFFTLVNVRKEDDKAYIEVFDRNKGEKGEIIDQCDFVEGKLHSIKFGEGDYEGDKYKTVAITLYDEESNTFYRVKCKFDKMNMIMRSILNRLLTAKSFDKISISFFGNKGEYKNASVRANNEKLEYMFDKDTVNKYIFPIKDRSGVVIKNDFTDLDNFLQEQVESIIIPSLPKQEKKEQQQKENNTEQESTQDPFAGEDTEKEAPF